MRRSPETLLATVAWILVACSGDPASASDPADTPPEATDGVDDWWAEDLLPELCPCSSTAKAPVPHIAHLFPINGRAFTTGRRVPAEEVPVAVLERAVRDGAASQQQLVLAYASRTLKGDRLVLTFDVVDEVDLVVIYVVDESSAILCCKTSYRALR